MSLYPELDKLTLEQLERCFQEPPVDGATYATAYYDAVAVLLEEKGQVGIEFWLDEMKKAGGWLKIGKAVTNIDKIFADCLCLMI